jgi:hypothetical protein
MPVATQHPAPLPAHKNSGLTNQDMSLHPSLVGSSYSGHALFICSLCNNPQLKALCSNNQETRTRHSGLDMDKGMRFL